MNGLKPLKEKTGGRITAFFLSFFLFLAASPLFAADLPGKMNSVASEIMTVFQGTGVKVLLACFLCGSAVAYAFNKDNEKVKRNCIAVGVAAAILMLAQTLVDWISGVAGT